MRDRFGRDINYGQGDRDWDRWDGDENRAQGRDHGRTVQGSGYGDYTLDEGRFVGGRERGHGDYDRGFSGYGREQDRDYGREQDRGYGREQDRGYGREQERGYSAYGREYDRGHGGYGREQERGWGQERGYGGYGRDYDRGFSGYGREQGRGYGGYGREQERGWGQERGYGGYGREHDRGFSGYGREQDRGWGQERGWGRDQERGWGQDRGWGRDQDRGFGQDFVREVRDAGRSAMQSVSGALSSAGDRVRSALGRGPKGYKRSDDRILEDICEMLSDRDDIDASEVTVRVQNCEVTLEGTVTERYHKRIIEQIAESVRGVEDVHNQIRVQRPGATATATSTTGTMGTTGTTGAQQTTSRGMANDVAHR
ncbi:BON domain-containing protein [Sorangium sp. So ce1024]|uniref:BON domain-containing protein n=1 Tax=Sorangium sp. So ce1024 TaxID=3133327 RepID=UPI003EFED614